MRCSSVECACCDGGGDGSGGNGNGIAALVHFNIVACSMQMKFGVFSVASSRTHFCLTVSSTSLLDFQCAVVAVIAVITKTKIFDSNMGVAVVVAASLMPKTTVFPSCVRRSLCSQVDPFPFFRSLSLSLSLISQRAACVYDDGIYCT